MATATRDFTDLGVLPCVLDDGVAARASIGLVALAVDETIESEFRRLLPSDGIGLYCSRIMIAEEVTPDNLRAVQPRLTASADLIRTGRPLDVVAFGCTSATMALGEATVFQELRKAHPGAACTTPATAAFAAFRALATKRIGVLTPYAPPVNAIVRKYLMDGGVHVTAFGTFNKIRDPDAARISLDSVEDGIAALAAAADLDAVFVSCTSIRLSERIAQLEDRLGMPITSSNHALAWHCLRLAGIDDVLPGSGRLFSLPLPS